MADLTHAPPPATIFGQTVVPVDFARVSGVVELDAGRRTGRMEAAVDFAMGEAAGMPLFDLRQPIASASLDGSPVAVRFVDLGGGPRAHLCVAERELRAGGTHRLALAADLGLPDAGDAVGVGWDDGRVRFDLWMSDLHPGRYLEQFLPANLVYDRFALEVELRLAGVQVDHLVLTNAAVEPLGDAAWRLRWPAHFTSLSPMLVVVPADEATVRSSRGATVAVARDAGVDADEVHDRVLALLDEEQATFGPYVHGDGPFTLWVWASTRGMEYDGGATSHVRAVEHEVFHSWFGRGVKPATAADGWIDEAFTTWWTNEDPRRWAQPFDWEEEPVVLHPASPWARHTPIPSYRSGSRFFAGLADRMGVDHLVDAMASFYVARRGDLVTTQQLEDHLSEAAGDDLSLPFARWVHGRDVS